MSFYHSTRSGANSVTSKQAILTGIAPDGGLYVSDELGEKRLSLEAVCDQTYHETARLVLGTLLGDYTGDELARCVEAIARNAEEFSRLSDLQFEFIERHERLGGGLVRVEYSDGSVLLINYADTPQQVDGREVAPLSYLRLTPARV